MWGIVKNRRQRRKNAVGLPLTAEQTAHAIIWQAPQRLKAERIKVKPAPLAACSEEQRSPAGQTNGAQ